MTNPKDTSNYDNHNYRETNSKKSTNNGDTQELDELGTNILSKLPREIVELVGRHSTHWNYTKLETLEALSEILAKLISHKEQEAYNKGWNDRNEHAPNDGYLEQEIKKARIDENQIYLNRINNWKPKAGELTAASFGSAGAGMVESSYKHAFENRIAELEAGVRGEALPNNDNVESENTK